MLARHRHPVANTCYRKPRGKEATRNGSCRKMADDGGIRRKQAEAGGSCEMADAALG